MYQLIKRNTTFFIIQGYIHVYNTLIMYKQQYGMGTCYSSLFQTTESAILVHKIGKRTGI